RVLSVLAILAALAAAACDRAPAADPAAQKNAAPAATAATAGTAAAQPAADAAQAPGEDDAGPGEGGGTLLQPWAGHRAGMVERRYVRVLVTFNRTNYYLDKADQRGLSFEAGKLFEKFLNDRLKMKTVKVHVAFIPVPREQLFDALLQGRGDIAAANLTVTEERQKRGAFADPITKSVNEGVVLAPDEKPVASVDDLAGRAVHVRRNS